jgi:hypothetical protein
MLPYEISCTKLQLRTEPLSRRLPPPHPRSLCPELNLLKPPPKKFPGYATDAGHSLFSSTIRYTMFLTNCDHATFNVDRC